MGNNEQSTEQTNKIQIGARIDPNVAAVIDKFATDEERTTSFVVDKLLKTHPRVEEAMANAAAGGAA